MINAKAVELIIQHLEVK